MRYELEFDYEYSECGDGCCSYFYDIVKVNDSEIYREDSPPHDFVDSVRTLFAVLNAREEGSETELTLTYSYVFDRDYDEDAFGEGGYPYGLIQDAIFLDGVLLTDEYYGMGTFENILKELGESYRVVTMDYDDKFFDETRELRLYESEDY